jgi:hypothetical protein
MPTKENVRNCNCAMGVIFDAQVVTVHYLKCSTTTIRQFTLHQEPVNSSASPLHTSEHVGLAIFLILPPKEQYYF